VTLERSDRVLVLGDALSVSMSQVADLRASLFCRRIEMQEKIFGLQNVHISKSDLVSWILRMLRRSSRDSPALWLRS
jgi:hypothetical protein